MPPIVRIRDIISKHRSEWEAAAEQREETKLTVRQEAYKDAAMARERLLTRLVLLIHHYVEKNLTTQMDITGGVATIPVDGSVFWPRGDEPVRWNIAVHDPISGKRTSGVKWSFMEALRSDGVLPKDTKWGEDFDIVVPVSE